MLLPIPIFISRYPYLRFKKINIFKSKTIYEKHSMGSDILNDWQKKLIVKNKNLLIENKIPINKIRFVFQPMFLYDVDNNIINPEYELMLPINSETGLINKKSPVIEINKPENLIQIAVGSYETINNYVFLKETLKRCERGIAIFIADEMIDNKVIRIAIIDDIVDRYLNRTK